jgi:hypothetical protein
MKKVFLLLVAFLVILSTVYATSLYACTSSDPFNIYIVYGSFEEPGRFSVMPRNLTGGVIEIVSVDSKEFLVVEDYSKGLVNSGEDLLISGTYPKENVIINGQLSLNYIDETGNEKEVIITCSGSRPPSLLEIKTLFISLGLGVLLLFLGLVTVFYSLKKEKKKLKIAGFLMVAAGACLILVFIATIILA